MSLVVCYSFMKENKFSQTVLVQEDEEETNTFKRDKDVCLILFFIV